MYKKLTISKLDVVKRQLETVIRLYFSNGDPVSIHTLTAAAYNVIRDINDKRGGEPLLVKEQFLDYIKEDHKEEVRKKINKAENFFKHAIRDHDSTIDFNPDESEMLILEACTTYFKLSGEFPPLFKLIQAWIIANNPDLYTFPEEIGKIMLEGSRDAVSLGREGYFNTYLPLISRVNT